MEDFFKYIIVSIVLLVLDGIWIFSNMDMYSASVQAVQKSKLIVNYYYAFVAYIFVIFTSLYIAIPFTVMNLKKSDDVASRLYKSVIYGGAVGLAVYAVYNFTCLALYKDYSFAVAAVDTAWGTVLNSFVVFVYTLL